jgi:hypothetical protein
MKKVSRAALPLLQQALAVKTVELNWTGFSADCYLFEKSHLQHCLLSVH